MKTEYLNYALKQLETILNIPSPSGFTEKAVEYCAKEFASLGFEPQISAKGGLIVCLGGEGEPIVLGAHLDTLGAIVREVKPNGALRVAAIGGLQANNTETESVQVYTRSGNVLEGTFQLENASVHVNGEYAKTQRTFDSVELLLDEKTHSAEQTRALGVEVGDFVAVEPRFKVTKSGFIKSRFLDDKLSAAILLAFAKYAHDEGIVFARKVYLDFTVFEEVGHGGAVIPKDAVEMLSVDMGCVGGTLQCDETMVSICVMDSRGPSSKKVVDDLVQAAKRANVRYALDVYPYYGSDADVALGAGYDVRHCVVGAGVYASHGYERSHVEGLSNTFDLLVSYLPAKVCEK